MLEHTKHHNINSERSCSCEKTNEQRIVKISQSKRNQEADNADLNAFNKPRDKHDMSLDILCFRFFASLKHVNDLQFFWFNSLLRYYLVLMLSNKTALPTPTSETYAKVIIFDDRFCSLPPSLPSCDATNDHIRNRTRDLLS